MSDDKLPGPACFTTDSARMDKFERKLDEVHIALVGNPQLGHRGLVDRITTVERHVANHNSKFLTWGGIVIGVMAALEFLKTKLFG